MCKLNRMASLKLSVSNPQIFKSIQIWLANSFFFLPFISSSYLLSKTLFEFFKNHVLLAAVYAYFNHLFSCFVVHFLSIYLPFYSYFVNFISFYAIYREFGVVSLMIVRLSKCDLRLTVVFPSPIVSFFFSINLME